MKTITTIIFICLSQIGNAQYQIPSYEYTGIPEIDTLIKKRDVLINSTINPRIGTTKDEISVDIILWYSYQIEQWKIGGKKKYCIYRYKTFDTGNLTHGFQIGEFVSECKSGFSGTYYDQLRDTLIPTPKLISHEGFMDWKTELILNRKQE